MADRYASEAVRSLHRIGVGVRADITERFATAEEPGRADLMCVFKSRGFYVEVKGGKTAFDMRNYRQNQREWAYQHALLESQTPVWIWLYLGQHAPHRNPAKYNPRKTWLIPVGKLLEVERKLAGIQSALPYRVKKGMKRQMQEQRLDAITQFAEYELQWDGGGVWTVPTLHPFYKAYIEPQPLFDLTGTTTLLESWVA